jgi:hypothetical protein
MDPLNVIGKCRGLGDLVYFVLILLVDLIFINRRISQEFYTP